LRRMLRRHLAVLESILSISSMPGFADRTFI
jgi:hypothetical protein